MKIKQVFVDVEMPLMKQKQKQHWSQYIFKNRSITLFLQFVIKHIKVKKLVFLIAVHFQEL